MKSILLVLYLHIILWFHNKYTNAQEADNLLASVLGIGNSSSNEQNKIAEILTEIEVDVDETNEPMSIENLSSDQKCSLAMEQYNAAIVKIYTKKFDAAVELLEKSIELCPSNILFKLMKCRTQNNLMSGNLTFLSNCFENIIKSVNLTEADFDVFAYYRDTLQQQIRSEIADRFVAIPDKITDLQPNSNKDNISHNLGSNGTVQFFWPTEIFVKSNAKLLSKTDIEHLNSVFLEYNEISKEFTTIDLSHENEEIKNQQKHCTYNNKRLLKLIKDHTNTSELLDRMITYTISQFPSSNLFHLNDLSISIENQYSECVDLSRSEYDSEITCLLTLISTNANDYDISLSNPNTGLKMLSISHLTNHSIAARFKMDSGDLICLNSEITRTIMPITERYSNEIARLVLNLHFKKQPITNLFDHDGIETNFNQNDVQFAVENSQFLNRSLLKTFWSTPIYTSMSKTFDFEFNENLKKSVLNSEHTTRGVQKSNRKGWQSQPDLFEHGKESVIKQLQFHVYREIKNFLLALNNYHPILQQFKGDFKIEIVSSWSCINRETSFNMPHLHPLNDLSGVYYVSTPTEESSIYFFADNSVHLTFNQSDTKHKRFIPKQGMIVLFPSSTLHYVAPHFKHSKIAQIQQINGIESSNQLIDDTEKNTRISISFNARINYEYKPNQRKARYLMPRDALVELE